ncbi:MAG: ORF6N domain-containing protein [Draconibacterium sp.]
MQNKKVSGFRNIVFLNKIHQIMELTLIRSKIYEIREQKVMLDFDLAELYGVETSQLKRSVRRNIERFEGDDFMFEVTREELSRCQIGTLNKSRGSNIKYLPFAFTELGVSMLSSVLNSKTAIGINRSIMRAFVAVRKLILTPPMDRLAELQKEIDNLKEYIEEVFSDFNDINEDTQMQLELINQTLAELQATKKTVEIPRKPIGFRNTEDSN